VSRFLPFAEETDRLDEFGVEGNRSRYGLS
jgi:hypothetical protein